METTKSISGPGKSYVSKTRIGVLAVSSMGMAALAITLILCSNRIQFFTQ